MHGPREVDQETRVDRPPLLAHRRVIKRFDADIETDIDHLQEILTELLKRVGMPQATMLQMQCCKRSERQATCTHVL